MDAQSAIAFVGEVLPLVLDFAGLVPGIAEAKNAITLVEDGIKVETTLYSAFESPAGAQTRANLTKLFADLGIKTDFGDAHIAVDLIGGFAPADWNSPVRVATDESPYSGNTAMNQP